MGIKKEACFCDLSKGLATSPLAECCVRDDGGIDGGDAERRVENGNQQEVNTKTGFRSSLWGFYDGRPSASNTLLTFA